MANSIQFSWDISEFDMLYESCKFDDNVKLILKYLTNKNAKILEIGCGSGRIVKYLYDLGYKNVEGIELNEQIVKDINIRFPYLRVYAGDLLTAQLDFNSYDFIISLGVVEHFWEGLQPPLKVHFDILKDGGIALVTVPSFNLFRRIVHCTDLLRPYFHIRTNPFLRQILGRKQLSIRNVSKFGYYIYPQFGDFFEYRLTPCQFKKETRKANFKIIESTPISHVDGLYHLFGNRYVSFENWKFTLNSKGNFLNTVLKLIPFTHNHMHALILTK